MSSTITNDENQQILERLVQYESIFKHYGLAKVSEDDFNRKKEIFSKNLYETKRRVLERNESNKNTINAKTITNKSKQPSTKNTEAMPKKNKKSEKKKKTEERDSVIKIKVPDAAKARKATYSHQQQQQSNQNLKSSKVASLHAPPRTPTTVQKLPAFDSKPDQSASGVQSSTNQVTSSTIPFNSTSIDGTNSIKDSTLITALPDTIESLYDFDKLNRFTREMFQRHDNIKSIPDSYRPRLNCPTDQESDVANYVQFRSQCLDNFEMYVNSLKRQHGIIRTAALDSPSFDPGITITGPHVKKEASIIDKEDARAIKKLISIEPRKKYALIHEQMGIFIIGGYNLYVNVPIQKDPQTDYLIKFNGEIVKISPLNPCRINFGIYTDGDNIYIAGGQTIRNELLDDIQCLNLQTLKWKHIATLTNPIAACGIALENKRIYLVGGYDILNNHTFFLTDHTIYNLSSKEFETAVDLPSPRCRSLVFALNHAVFCISGLVEDRDENNNRKIKISTDILKWTQETSQWIKVSQTPELTKFHALSFNESYLEITKRHLNEQGIEVTAIPEAYYDFQTNSWGSGKAPTLLKSSPPTQSTKTSTKSMVPSPRKRSTKSNTSVVKPSSKMKSPNKSNSPIKNKSLSKAKKHDVKKK